VRDRGAGAPAAGGLRALVVRRPGGSLERLDRRGPPLLVFFSGYLLTETTLCAALLLALFLSAEWVRTPRGGRALGVGLAWRVAALTRPTALLLPAIVAAWAWQPLGLTLGGRARARQVGLILLGLAVVVGP
jgi:hypothetical protein